MLAPFYLEKLFKWHKGFFFYRVFQIFREDGSFGFVIKGNNPVCVESVDPLGPADKAGLQAGDVILKLNSIDVR